MSFILQKSKFLIITTTCVASWLAVVFPEVEQREAGNCTLRLLAIPQEIASQSLHLISAIHLFCDVCKFAAYPSPKFLHVVILYDFWLPWQLSDKEFTCNARDTSLIPGSGRSLGEGTGSPLQ